MTNPTNSLPQTENEAWGFRGTMDVHPNPEEAWNIAIAGISAATGATLDETRVFLDSRYGRHFADEVGGWVRIGDSNQKAIDAAIKLWMGWTITKGTAKHTGIPQGMAYLTGFVMHANIEKEMHDDSTS